MILASKDASGPFVSLHNLKNCRSAFDAITELTALACGASCAGIVLLERDGFGLLSGFGMESPDWMGKFGIDEAILKEFLESGITGNASDDVAAALLGSSDKPLGFLFITGGMPSEKCRGKSEILPRFAKQVESQIERCRAESVCDESAKFFGTRIESAIEGIMILEKSGKIRETNQTALQFLEIDSLDEAVGVDFLGMVTAGYCEKVTELLRLAYEGTEGMTEFRFSGKNGGKCWLETLFSPLRGPGGNVDGVLAVHRDITIWKKREEGMLLRNDGLEHSLSGFDLVDTEGKLIYANRAYLDLWGYESSDEVIGKSPVDHCRDPKVPEKIIDALKSEGRCNIEFTAQRKDGSTFEALMSARLIHDADGREIYTGSTVDITERKETEEALRASREHLNSLISSVDGIVWEADPETFRFSYVNQQAEAILGYPPSDWTENETFWADHIHPDDRDFAVNYCKSCTEKAEDHEFVYRMITADGRVVWLRDLVSVGCEDGKPTTLRGIMVDITEQQNAELRIRQLNRTHSVLSEINQLTVREKDQHSLLMKGCKIAVETGRFAMAWIGLIDSEEGNLDLVGHAGASDSEIQILRSMLGDSENPPACCFTARSLSMARHEVCNDIATHPETVAWREKALASGYHSIASLPLIRDGKVVGNFNLYSEESGFFDESEMELLDRLAEDISFALSVHEKEKKRRAIERELRTSQKKLTTSMQIARLADWEYDLKKGRFILNDQLFDLLRVDIDEMERYDISPFKLFRRFCYTQDIPKLMKIVYRLVSQNDEEVVRLETRAVLGDGKLGWFAIQAFSDRDEEGRPMRVHGIVQDITESKEAEDALMKVEHRFRRLIEHSSDCIVLIDEQYRILYASPSACRIEGDKAENLAGRNIFGEIHSDDSSILDESLARLKAEPSTPVELFWRKHGEDGSVIWLEGLATNLLEEPGVEAIVVNYRDVTARKQLEEEFRQSQKLEAIGQLAGGVAHDFNNILTIISGYGSLLMMDEANSPEMEEASKQIVQASERAAGLTRQLLAFSRRQVLQPQLLDLNENVSSLTNMLQRILGEDVRLVIELHNGALPTRADAGMLDQLLMNLVVNSRDAMPDGGTLTIETKSCHLGEESRRRFPDAKPGPYVQMRVCDTGEGISEENLARIFEPFFTTKDQGKGTGLGLATVFGIVKQHSGVISVESEVGKGTCFVILLPAIEMNAGFRDVAKVETAIENGSETILLVEDEEPVRNLGRHVLERAGYTVIEAADGIEAKKIWEANREEIDLLFTDIVMPGGVSGFELASALQEIDPDLGVIFISGYSADIAGRELNLEEGQNFVQKPCSPRTMLEIVRKCLDERISPLYS